MDSTLVLPLIGASAALTGWFLGSWWCRKKPRHLEMRIVNVSGHLHARHVARPGELLTWHLPEETGAEEAWICFDHDCVCVFNPASGPSQKNNFCVTKGGSFSCTIQSLSQEEGYNISPTRPAKCAPGNEEMLGDHCEGCSFVPGDN
jgi:hypothetical protein